jgi:hypothetical protein
VIPTQQDVIKLIGIPDYALAGKIVKDLNELKNAEEVFSEIGQPYETGFFQGCNGWTSFRRMPSNTWQYAKWGRWKKILTEAKIEVSKRGGFKPIGPIIEEVVKELTSQERF